VLLVVLTAMQGLLQRPPVKHLLKAHDIHPHAIELGPNPSQLFEVARLGVGLALVKLAIGQNQVIEVKGADAELVAFHGGVGLRGGWVGKGMGSVGHHNSPRLWQKDCCDPRCRGKGGWVDG
jgi:hypothetical protein